MSEPVDPTFWATAGSLAVAVGLGGLATWYFRETLKELLPTPHRIARWLRVWRGDVVRAKGTHFTILIADLDGDDDRRQTRHVRAALLGRPGLEVQFTGQLLHVTDLGSQTEAQIEAERRGHELLEKGNGDLLIWGEVRAVDRELNLWFLSGGGTSTLGAPSYTLTEKLSLPEDFDQDLAAQLEALALASLAPATEQEGHYLVDLLRRPVQKIERLLDRVSPGFEAGQIAGLQVALGNAATVIGEQSGDSSWLEKAIDAYCAALEERTRERVPLDWAATQNNLGCALWTLGWRERDTARMEEAVDALRAALEERTRERAPLDWAVTQDNLGNALWRLGERESGTSRMEEAVDAYRAALEERTRERAPLDWAATQDNMGNALWMLGQRESGTARLEEAVEVLRAALEERARERVPLDWAWTQNNLGNALATLGERENSMARMEEAVEVLRAALEERTRKRAPLDWARTQNNLGNALRILGEREGGTAQLEEALVAYRQALEERTRERVPLQWAMTQNNLACALATLGERENSMARMEEALRATKGAFEVRVGEAKLVQYESYYLDRIKALEADVESMKSGA